MTARRRVHSGSRGPREQVLPGFSRLYPAGVGAGPLSSPKEGTMSAQKITRIVAIAVVTSVAALIPDPSIGVASVSASARKGELHVTKECGDYHGAAGEFCTITSSNLTEIVNNSKVF